MIIKEVKKDLFTISNDYALVHCISADFKQWECNTELDSPACKDWKGVYDT